jgi:hypothetical protein
MLHRVVKCVLNKRAGSWRCDVHRAATNAVGNPHSQRMDRLWSKGLATDTSAPAINSPSPCGSDVCGFSRPDMQSPRKKLKFKCHDAHVFVGTGPVATSSAEEEWGTRFERTSLGRVYHDALKSNSPPKVARGSSAAGLRRSQIKVSACDAPQGTVLMFPHWLQLTK